MACSLSICAFGQAHADPAAPKILKFGYILSPHSQLGEGEKVFAAEVAARTNGRYEIESYPDSMLGGEVAMMRDVQIGVLDCAFITGAPLPNLLPAAGVFNIPFLFHDARQARAVLDGPIGDDYLKKFDKLGLVALAWGENGMRHVTNSRHPIRGPDDLNGLKLRLPQSDVMALGFGALGANVQQIPFPQVYGVLRSGSVDGEENPIATILSAKFYEVQHYLTLTGHVYDPALIMMSSDAYAGLSEADKQAFRAAAKLAAAASRRTASDMENRGIAALKAHGMVVIDSVDTDAFARRVAAVSATFDKKFGAAEIRRIKIAAAAADTAGPDSAAKMTPSKARP